MYKKGDRKMVAFIENHLWKIQQLLYLENWDIEVGDEPVEQKEWPNMESSNFAIKVNDTYLKASLLFGDRARELFKNECYRTLVQSLIHEVCHIVTSPIWNGTDKYVKELERGTEQVARWVWWLYRPYMQKHKINIKTGLIHEKPKKSGAKSSQSKKKKA